MLFLVLLSQVNTIQKNDWKTVTKFLGENVNKENDMIFIFPFYHQDPFIYYYSDHCFTEWEIYECGFKNHNLLSLNHSVVCCENNSKVYSPIGGETISDFISKPIWLVSVYEESNDKDLTLFGYFNNTKQLNLTRYFDGGIKVYKFE